MGKLTQPRLQAVQIVGLLHVGLKKREDKHDPLLLSDIVVWLNCVLVAMLARYRR
jgi:hypothetical protein